MFSYDEGPHGASELYQSVYASLGALVPFVLTVRLALASYLLISFMSITMTVLVIMTGVFIGMAFPHLCPYTLWYQFHASQVFYSSRHMDSDVFDLIMDHD